MSELRRNIKNIDGDSVVRFDSTALSFGQGKNLLLTSELNSNIQNLLAKQSLDLLSKGDGWDCQFMGDGVGTWRKAKLSITIELTIDVDDSNNGANSTHDV